MFNFGEYLQKIEEQNTVGTHNDGPGSGFAGAGGMSFLPSHYTGSETYKTPLASLDGVIQKSLEGLDLHNGKVPLVKRESRVMYIRKESNPIYVHLEDGTRLFLTRGQWERCGKPEVGRKMLVAMQRRPNDMSESPSQIQWAKVI